MGSFYKLIIPNFIVIINKLIAKDQMLSYAQSLLLNLKKKTLSGILHSEINIQKGGEQFSAQPREKIFKNLLLFHLIRFWEVDGTKDFSLNIQ